MVPDALHKAIDQIVPAGVTHVGFVPTNIAGDVLVAEPHGHPHGVSATFGKVKISNGERPSQALVRCLAEQVGVATASAYPIPSTWVTPNSASFYFAGLIHQQHEAVSSPTAVLRWLTPEQARARIGQSPSAATRQRDLAVLSSVGQMCLSPLRNVLLMIRELHRMGFERFRARTYIHSIGYWRCEVVPATWISRDEQRADEDILWRMRYRLEQILDTKLIQFYTGANEQSVFQSPETVFMTPDQLAQRFIRERREIAVAGFGPDPEYVAWYEAILNLLAPNGVFYAFAEFKDVTDHLYTLDSRVGHVPLPPPGLMDGSNWEGFLARLEPPEEA